MVYGTRIPIQENIHLHTACIHTIPKCDSPEFHPLNMMHGAQGAGEYFPTNTCPAYPCRTITSLILALDAELF